MCRDGQNQGCPCRVAVIVMSGPCSPSGRAWAAAAGVAVRKGNTGLEEQHLRDGLRKRAW